MYWAGWRMALKISWAWMTVGSPCGGWLGIWCATKLRGSNDKNGRMSWPLEPGARHGHPAVWRATEHSEKEMHDAKLVRKSTHSHEPHASRQGLVGALIHDQPEKDARRSTFKVSWHSGMLASSGPCRCHSCCRTWGCGEGGQHDKHPGHGRGTHDRRKPRERGVVQCKTGYWF